MIWMLQLEKRKVSQNSHLFPNPRRLPGPREHWHLSQIVNSCKQNLKSHEMSHAASYPGLGDYRSHYICDICGHQGVKITEIAQTEEPVGTLRYSICDLNARKEQWRINDLSHICCELKQIQAQITKTSKILHGKGSANGYPECFEPSFSSVPTLVLKSVTGQLRNIMNLIILEDNMTSCIW